MRDRTFLLSGTAASAQDAIIEMNDPSFKDAKVWSNFPQPRIWPATLGDAEVISPEAGAAITCELVTIHPQSLHTALAHPPPTPGAGRAKSRSERQSFPYREQSPIKEAKDEESKGAEATQVNQHDTFLNSLHGSAVHGDHRPQLFHQSVRSGHCTCGDDARARFEVIRSATPSGSRSRG